MFQETLDVKFAKVLVLDIAIEQIVDHGTIPITVTVSTCCFLLEKEKCKSDIFELPMMIS